MIFEYTRPLVITTPDMTKEQVISKLTSQLESFATELLDARLKVHMYNALDEYLSAAIDEVQGRLEEEYKPQRRVYITQTHAPQESK